MIWKPIEGYQIPYRINDKGQVQGFWHGSWRDKEAIYNKYFNSCSVRLKRNGRHFPKTVGRLMADAFMGGVKEDEIVIHKNGIISDNALVNLEKVPRKGTFVSGTITNRKCVFAIDMKGNVKTVYPSITAAADGERLNKDTIRKYCREKTPVLCEKTGLRYEFEDKRNKWEGVGLK